MKIAIGSDHAGYDYRQMLIEHLRAQGHEVVDCGCPDKSSCDYPVYGRKTALLVKRGECERGVLVCGTGFGISLAANRLSGIRCVNCTDVLTAKMSRLHNDANMIAVGARVVGEDTAKLLVDTFLATEHEGGRHARRVELIDSLPME